MSGAMNGNFRSGSLTLNRYLAVPSGHNPQLPGVILCHGFPIGPLDARQSAVTFPQLMDRVANDLGWAALTFTFRGCGESDGDFSMQGWVDDLRAAIDHLEEEVSPQGIWLVGTNTGGALDAFFVDEIIQALFGFQFGHSKGFSCGILAVAPDWSIARGFNAV